MTGNQTRIARVRKEQYGGNCAICNQPVELLSGDPPKLKCACAIVDIPNWVNIDNFSRAQFHRRFELRAIPKETEG